MKNELSDLETVIGKQTIVLLPLLRTKNEIPYEEFEILFSLLEELVILIKGQESLPRSLAYKLFHLNEEVRKQLSYFDVNDQKVQLLRSRLVILTVQVFNDNMFAE